MKKGTYVDLSGKHFGRIEIVSLHSQTCQGTFWNAKCDCGTSFVVRGVNAKRGHTTSCGCRGLEALSENRTTHGLSHTPEYRLWVQAKGRARKLGRNFDLDLTDIVIPDICPMLDIPLFRGIGKHCSNSPSVDCIRPELGYVKGNVWVVSYRANTLKSNLTLEQLKTLVSRIENKIGGCNE